MTAVRRSHLNQGGPAEPAEGRRRSGPQPMETIVAAVERIPVVKVETDEAETSANVRVGTRIVARLDLAHGRVLVHTPADAAQTLRRVFPSSRPTAGGIAFDLGGSEDCSEALASIVERVKAEIFMHQARWSSP
jgi:hypothetical protein